MLACGVVYVGPVYLAYREFRTEVAGVTRAGGRGPERELVAVVAGLAERIGVPVAREAIKMRKEGDPHVSRGDLHEELRLAPAVTYPWTFMCRS